MPTCFEQARRRYRPRCIKYLLIAEAPPSVESGRFFYYERVPKYDSLFLETMKVLYPNDCGNIPDVRKNKPMFLDQFMNDGFYLIDSMDSPLINLKNRVGQIRTSLPSLKEKIGRLANKNTKIILISRPVYDACFQELRDSNYNVINTEMIDFPGSSGQGKFRDKMSRLLARHPVNQQKGVEYKYLEYFLALFTDHLQLGNDDIECRESPDFIVNMNGKRIGIELTEHYASDKDDHNGRPRQAVETQWELLREAIMNRVWKDDYLRKTDGILEFKKLELPPRRQFSSFIDELIRLSKIMLSSHCEHAVIDEKTYPVLFEYLRSMNLKPAGCYISWNWNYDSGWVGLTEQELMATIKRKTKLADKYKSSVDEMWLVVIEGHRISQGMGLFLDQHLNQFEEVNQLLSTSRFNSVFIYQYMHNVIYQWPGWTKIGKEHLIETIKESS